MHRAFEWIILTFGESKTPISLPLAKLNLFIKLDQILIYIDARLEAENVHANAHSGWMATTNSFLQVREEM